MHCAAAHVHPHTAQTERREVRGGGVRSGSEVEEKAFLSQRESDGMLQDKPYCRTLLPLTSHYMTKQCTHSAVQTRGGAPALDSYNSRAARSPERKMHTRSTLEATCSHTLSVRTKCLRLQRGKKKQPPKKWLPRKLNYVWGKTHFVREARFYRSRGCLSPRLAFNNMLSSGGRLPV